MSFFSNCSRFSDIMMLCHPPILCRACYVAAGLSASCVSSFATTTKKRKNLLTGEFEVLVVVKLWNKELPVVFVCCDQYRKTPQTVVRFSKLCSLQKHGCQKVDLLLWCGSGPTEKNGFSIPASGSGTSLARWLGYVLQFLHLNCCRWMIN